MKRREEDEWQFPSIAEMSLLPAQIWAPKLTPSIGVRRRGRRQKLSKKRRIKSAWNSWNTKLTKIQRMLQRFAENWFITRHLSRWRGNIETEITRANQREAYSTTSSRKKRPLNLHEIACSDVKFYHAPKSHCHKKYLSFFISEVNISLILTNVFQTLRE